MYSQTTKSTDNGNKPWTSSPPIQEHALDGPCMVAFFLLSTSFTAKDANQLSQVGSAISGEARNPSTIQQRPR